MKDALKELFIRDLTILKREIKSYKTPTTLWKVSGDITNSGGNLCLHLIGNLKTYLGNTFGDTTYNRDRLREFTAKNVEVLILLEEIDETIAIVKRAFGNLSDEDLTKTFPVMIWETQTSMDYTLMHLHGHLTYHLGQINYHRRLMDIV